MGKARVQRIFKSHAKRAQGYPADAAAWRQYGAHGHWIEPTSKTASPVERTGEQIVRAQCSKCHQKGLNGAPKIGDRDAWTPRLKDGLDPLVRSAINGHGSMPARGGLANLTDAELRSAIIYMFNKGTAPAK
jgi:cytochrome c5